MYIVAATLCYVMKRWTAFKYLFRFLAYHLRCISGSDTSFSSRKVEELPSIVFSTSSVTSMIEEYSNLISQMLVTEAHDIIRIIISRFSIE